jgi:Rrf2 family protein
VSKILGELVRADILTSTKGRGGGFGLARAADRIRLIHVVEVIDGLRNYRACVAGLSHCNDQQPCPQHEAVAPIRDKILAYLKDTTIQSMVVAMRRKGELVEADLTAFGLPVSRQTCELAVPVN